MRERLEMLVSIGGVWRQTLPAYLVLTTLGDSSTMTVRMLYLRCATEQGYRQRHPVFISLVCGTVSGNLYFLGP